jgi:hypothetical protein
MNEIIILASFSTLHSLVMDEMKDSTKRLAP